MSNLNKFLIFIAIVSVVFSLAFVAYKQAEISKRQTAIEQSIIKQKDIGDNITRAMSQYVTSKDLETLIKSNGMDLSKINKDVSALNSKIDSINVVIGNSIGYDWHGLDSTETKDPPPSDSPPPKVKCDGEEIDCLQDPNHYFAKTQILEVNEKFKDLTVPFGKVGFSASSGKPWDLSVYGRQYKIITVTSLDENRRANTYNKIEISIGDKVYQLPDVTATNSQTYPEAKFRWFSPRLFLGFDSGINLNRVNAELSPLLSVALMNYGIFNQNPDFSILQLGLAFGANNHLGYFSLTPVAYNIGKHLPLIENTYLGASFNLSPGPNEIAIMAGLRVGL